MGDDAQLASGGTVRLSVWGFVHWEEIFRKGGGVIFKRKLSGGMSGKNCVRENVRQGLGFA